MSKRKEIPTADQLATRAVESVLDNVYDTVAEAVERARRDHYHKGNLRYAFTGQPGDDDSHIAVEAIFKSILEDHGYQILGVADGCNVLDCPGGCTHEAPPGRRGRVITFTWEKNAREKIAKLAKDMAGPSYSAKAAAPAGNPPPPAAASKAPTACSPNLPASWYDEYIPTTLYPSGNEHNLCLRCETSEAVVIQGPCGHVLHCRDCADAYSYSKQDETVIDVRRRERVCDVCKRAVSCLLVT